MRTRLPNTKPKHHLIFIRRYKSEMKIYNAHKVEAKNKQEAGTSVSASAKKSKVSGLDDVNVIVLEVCQTAVEVEKNSENTDESKNQL
jgi:hypothetical protein